MPGNRRPRQMVTVPRGTQNPAYAPLSAHNPHIEFNFVAKQAVRRERSGNSSPKKRRLNAQYVFARDRRLLGKEKAGGPSPAVGSKFNRAARTIVFSSLVRLMFRPAQPSAALPPGKPGIRRRSVPVVASRLIA